MARQTYADNVDANGKVFKTVGDNIRMGARAGELIDFSTITDKLDALEPEISALQADVTENEKGIKKNSDDISSLNEDLVKETDRAKQEEKRIESLFTGDVEVSVANWLNEHPEATTTVQDGAITEVKISNSLLPFIKNEYVTPEMFGAIGDGVADDTTAIKTAINNGSVIIGNKVYNITEPINVPSYKKIIFNNKITNNSGNVFEINGTQVSIYAKRILSSNNCFSIGNNVFTQFVDISFGSIHGENGFLIGGNSDGTLDVNITGNYIGFTGNAIKIDTTNSYVGEIHFYNARLQSDTPTNNYAIDIDCDYNTCTGISLTNLSFEGDMNGIHVYNMHDNKTCEYINIDNARITELTSKYNKKAIKFETKENYTSSSVRGYINFDYANTDSFDFSNYKPDIVDTFRGSGYVSSFTGHHYIGFSTFYGCISYYLSKQSQTVEGTPDRNTIYAKMIIVDTDGGRTNYKNFLPCEEIYIYFKVDATYTIRLNAETSSQIAINGKANEIYKLLFVPNANSKGGKSYLYLISANASQYDY